MKIRTGFVSNSSSSSFVVIEPRNEDVLPMLYPIPDKNGTYTIGKDGQTEFGWGPDRFYDIDSKVNWAWLQARDEPKGIFTKILMEILLEAPGIKKVKCCLVNSWKEGKEEGKSWGYIDHQSLGWKNHDMFLAPERLKDFLFSSESFIVLDNDNH